MDIFEKKALELQEQLYTDGYKYSFYQVKLALSQWLVEASHHLIANANDYIFGENQIVGDAFKPEEFPPMKRYVLTDGQTVVDVKLMTDLEYKNAQDLAKARTGKNWSWLEVKPGNLSENYLQASNDCEICH